jgi:anti-sigma B factor antagonist
VAVEALGLRCDARERGDELVLAVSGELDLHTAPQLCARVEATFRGRHARVLLDLSELAFCDSTGLRALLGVAREAQVHGLPLGVVAPRAAAPARTFEIAGALEFLPLTRR